ncbi:MAG: hypothetical protein VW551_04935 [Euryarchaeota archaeon]
MHGTDDFKNYMKSAYTIETDTRVIAEWNMNLPENIKEVGNYRYRPNKNVFKELPTEWNEVDDYTIGATDSDVVINSDAVSKADQPIVFTDKKEKMKLLYSLDECFEPRRPRSGINKPLYLGYTSSDAVASQYVNNYGKHIDKRPRYYMGSRHDSFKYWTSYRTEVDGDETKEYGISGSDFTIEDVAPYVVYNNPVPANRIVIKMQTNVGSHDLGKIRVGDQYIDDPLYDNRGSGNNTNATIPENIYVEVLINNNWVPAATINESDISTDGYAELSYGYVFPHEGTLMGEFEYRDSLPISAGIGDTYWVHETDNKGYYIYTREGAFRGWEHSLGEYTWKVQPQGIDEDTPFVHDLKASSQDELKQFVYIEGIRIYVTTMLKKNSTFDLIELSPRLVADITPRTMNFNVSKTLGDLGNSSLPIGRFLAGTGNITINNNDAIFSYENENSIIANYLHSKIKFNFYDVVRQVNGDSVYVPIKTLYSEGFPQSTGTFDQVTLNLRDAYGTLESEKAPELFLQDISLSFAITMLLDSIGFSNYKFYRRQVEKQVVENGVLQTIQEEEDKEFIIPFFFVAPGQTVAAVLQQLAQAAQVSMWFDEYNNFCVGSKSWTLPSDGWRLSDGVLRAENKDGELANIIDIASAEKRVSNAGNIQYTERYIQREYEALKQAYNTTEWKSWVYKPTMLWEVSADTVLRDYNTIAKEGSTYSLSAIPLNSDLSSDLPRVDDMTGELVNNIVDFGEGISWLGRANGYFYSNGEIIKFDSMEYVVYGTGVVWIENNDEYQDYIATLPFGGKIYPTGRVRIWSEPYYEIGPDGKRRLQKGAVKSHGRGQFGTKITDHFAGIDSYWTNDVNCYGMNMNSEYMFSADYTRKYPLELENPNTPTAASVNTNARTSERGSIIKNFLADSYQAENENLRFGTTHRGTVQASSFVFQGPQAFNDSDGKPSKLTDNITYVLKDFEDEAPYHHFGTRFRVVGEITSDSNTKQKAIGAGEYVSFQPENANEEITITGGSGGIGVQVNPAKNEGYFLELIALSSDVSNRKSNYQAFAATYKLSNKNFTINTATEHNIDRGDKFYVYNTGADGANDEIVGKWKAEGVDKKKGTINFRSEEVDANLGIALGNNISVQKVGEPTGNISTMIFYKMQEDTATGEIVPYVLWEGIAEILCDDGKFTDIQRLVGQEKTSVYDIAIEFKDQNAQRTFFLYINGKQVGTVTDVEPYTSPRNNVALFTRGHSKCMFNNVYALTERYSENTAAVAVSADTIPSVFGAKEITSVDALQKYGVSGFVQRSYLNGISTENGPEYQMYFEEFGSIMREAAFMNIKYDAAWPALSAIIAPTLNNSKSYTTSGFFAGAYGAEFLIFNTSDTVVSLSAETGNFLRILGVTFTQDTTKTLTVDDYFNRVADLSNPTVKDGKLILDPVKYRELWEAVARSRQSYGTVEFESIESPYIQDDGTAEEMVGWIMSKTLRPRQLVGLNVFGMPHMQLGDIYTIDYAFAPLDNTLENKVDVIADAAKQFVTYQVDFTKNEAGSQMTAYLVEV